MDTKKLMFDFDNTIHDANKGWCDGLVYGSPTLNSRNGIKLLVEHGFECVILTARTDFEPIIQWLKDNEFPTLRVTNIKEPALAYIDDRGVRYQGNFMDIVRLFI